MFGGVVLNFHTAVDVLWARAGVLMDMAMQVILHLEHGALMQRHMSEHTVELWEHAPHHDLLEVTVQVLVLAVVMVAQDQSFTTTQTGQYGSTVTHVHIAQVVYDVAIFDHAVPLIDHVLIHEINIIPLGTYSGPSGAVCELEHVLMPKVCVADDPDVSHEPDHSSAMLNPP